VVEHLSSNQSEKKILRCLIKHRNVTHTQKGKTINENFSKRSNKLYVMGKDFKAGTINIFKEQN
jgi:hypothetical protein